MRHNGYKLKREVQAGYKNELFLCEDSQELDEAAHSWRFSRLSLIKP